MDTPGNTPSFSRVTQLGSTVEQALGGLSLNAKSFISSTFWPIPNTRIPSGWRITRRLTHLVRFLASRSCEKDRQWAS
jgi:hypothetical protein